MKGLRAILAISSVAIVLMGVGLFSIVQRLNAFTGGAVAQKERRFVAYMLCGILGLCLYLWL